MITLLSVLLLCLYHQSHGVRWGGDGVSPPPGFMRASVGCEGHIIVFGGRDQYNIPGSDVFAVRRQVIDETVITLTRLVQYNMRTKIWQKLELTGKKPPAYEITRLACINNTVFLAE